MEEVFDLVTCSRLHAVRYRLALDRTLKERGRRRLLDLLFEEFWQEVGEG